MDLLEPFAGVETGTGLADAREVAVTEDLGIGEVDAEAAEQFFHGDLLCFGGVSAGRPLASSPPS